MLLHVEWLSNCWGNAFRQMRIFAISAALAAYIGLVSGTTLQQLSLDNMTRKSSEIVRGKVLCTGVALRGATLYTNFRVQVSEQWKGAPSSKLDFAVPGGFGNGIRQTYAGAPAIADGQEFVLFLWTSTSGLRRFRASPFVTFRAGRPQPARPAATRTWRRSAGGPWPPARLPETSFCNMAGAPIARVGIADCDNRPGTR